MNRLGVLLTLLFIAATSCSKKHEKSVQLLYGPCSVEVVSKTPGAEVVVDGILLGEEEEYLVDIPCGQKELRVEKEGFAPYQEFLPVSKSQPLKVTVTLEPVKAASHYELSDKIIEQTRKGEALIDPLGGPEQKAEAIRLADARIASEKSARSKMGGVSGVSSASPTTVEKGNWDKADDWR
jgi:hypothetical protein